MAAAIIIPVSFFLVVLAITYLYFSTRNRERMALIEKGADASIFVKGKRERTAPFWKVLVLNLALLLMGIGLAIFLAAAFVHTLGMDDEVAYPGTIFFMAGSGLLVGFFLTKKLDKEDV
ncbi:DUF6249 domain-containing protein [Flavobacteriaceae bacterium 3-367]|uniref:DUF6249 domain-containing protein n=1 Tax=Eudoraea algarum TaxID=3417568 RepID=UPI0032790FEF